MVGGSPLWQARAEPQNAHKPEIAESLSQSKDNPPLTGNATLCRIARHQAGRGRRSITLGCGAYGTATPDMAEILTRLIALEDDAVMRVPTFLMAETLAAHTDMVETLFRMFGTDLRGWWTPDACFLDLMRDKQAITAMVREILNQVKWRVELRRTMTTVPSNCARAMPLNLVLHQNDDVILTVVE